MKILVTGASGSGATTLGKALANQLAISHLDTDHYFWMPTSPPYKESRLLAERSSLLQADVESQTNVVVSGSILGWGEAIENAFDLVVFLYVPSNIRVERLRQREVDKYGVVDPDFLVWASQYDEGPPTGRSLAKHNAWLASRSCEVLRLEGDISVSERVARVIQAIPKIQL